MLLGATGCTHRIWLTQDLREDYELGVIDGEVASADTTAKHSAAELQYFIADRVVLQRQVSGRSDDVARGRIRVRQGRFVDTVVIPRGTPGIAAVVETGALQISFEEGSAFTFMPNERTGIYELQTVEGEGEWPTIEVDGEFYWVQRGARAQLRVRREDRMQHSFRRRAMKGRRLD
ncbi:hypothetical protein PPSIR1_41539 [Plesiocystis pacifica SIR-1]|uniref:Uncharacterized protein n=1 Tax=Plesiocystis pacifica SIR-1 TaxID=391625 RepID=A6G0P9_9BACT|nr:hypothetical protein [Plesiocystis pacifica]EDM80437.1 hypothetical protein PPSIR1_41539 [Plesiocystis pacifica SIR-1]